jgi:PHP domain
MVSLKLSNVYDGVFRSELALGTDVRNHEARERLAGVLDELRRNKGWSVILRGHDFRLRDAPRDIVNERTKPQLKIRVQIQQRSAPVRATTYVPLRIRSYYTFLDSTLSPAAVVNLAKQYDIPAIALTDIGNLHGAVEFAQAAKCAGVKPIFGAELLVGQHPLLLYVESPRGYHNLNRLLTRNAETATGEEGAVATQLRRPISIDRVDDLTEGLIPHLHLPVPLQGGWPNSIPSVDATRRNWRRPDSVARIALPCARGAGKSLQPARMGQTPKNRRHAIPLGHRGMNRRQTKTRYEQCVQSGVLAPLASPLGRNHRR